MPVRKQILIFVLYPKCICRFFDNKAQYYGVNILGEEEASAPSQRLSTLDLQVVVFWLPAPRAELHRSGLSLRFQVHTSALKGY